MVVDRSIAKLYEGSGGAVMREHVCPECHSKHITRAIRNDFLERLMLMLRRKRVYRCLECDHRFHDHPISGQRPPEKP